MGDSLRGKGLSSCLVVEAADGYRVVIALPELDPGFTRSINPSGRSGRRSSPRQQRRSLSYRRPRREEDGKMGPPGDNPQSRAGAVGLVFSRTPLDRRFLTIVSAPAGQWQADLADFAGSLWRQKDSRTCRLC